ncbi:N-acetylglucosamine 6-phosphate deacetylase [Tindallia magadiensis]|uniref:N-acetylglucosamine-6-phosphate deacetylase n=1 Tax=Tindallia magadiensis TaxID=69895 RepID=A0A1I3HNM9_9FIRM|nr:N-acetylglucosamine-6-phosphate deacetylase [Tindallia magadiensis]SFI37110.1 N-acetylglucosamine 6-phosphate deacetylase [Tindallia magadiensis]
MKAITGGKLYYNHQFHDKKTLLYSEKIVSICEDDQCPKEEVEEEIRLQGELVLPGFIDLHIHGYHDYDTMDGTVASIQHISRALLQNGVTSFLPTTMTMSKAKITKALEAIRSVQQSSWNSGARVLGAHMEGPFINKAKKGAQSSKDIIPVDEEIMKAYDDVIKLITLAPEIPGAMEAIEKWSNKFVFSLGHTSATYEQAKEGMEKGAKGVTHLFNAMSPMNHREPGVVGLALTTDCYAELICDNFHVNPSIYKLVMTAKGDERILLVTDCIRAGGMEDGMYDLGGQEVMVKGIRCTLKDGTIAGSILNYPEGVRNFSTHTQAGLESVLKMTSENQAAYLGMKDILGQIAVDQYADFAILDQAFNVTHTIVSGQLLYTKSEGLLAP